MTNFTRNHITGELIPLEQEMDPVKLTPWTVDMDVTFLAQDQEDAIRWAHRIADALEKSDFEVTLGENYREGNE